MTQGRKSQVVWREWGVPGEAKALALDIYADARANSVRHRNDVSTALYRVTVTVEEVKRKFTKPVDKPAKV